EVSISHRARVLVYRSTWERSSEADKPSRIICRLYRAGLFAGYTGQKRWASSLYRARALARYAEQKGTWASSWPSPEQEPPK
ncbi:hypothetical protein A2U01_0071305, partial [Trifolium medium]|nr:hypothetical protein [Trifolium medium]